MFEKIKLNYHPSHTPKVTPQFEIVLNIDLETLINVYFINFRFIISINSVFSYFSFFVNRIDFVIRCNQGL